MRGKKLLVVTGWLVPEANGKPNKIIEAEIREELETTLTPGVIPYLQKIERVSVLSMNDPDELQAMDEANKEWAEAWKKRR
ncbi:MAG: hypothetical protein ACE5OW_04040 [Candidatus Bathyarchaeia archaeon]